jgi:hypothetical protein
VLQKETAVLRSQCSKLQVQRIPPHSLISLVDDPPTCQLVEVHQTNGHTSAAAVNCSLQHYFQGNSIYLYISLSSRILPLYAINLIWTHRIYSPSTGFLCGHAETAGQLCAKSGAARAAGKRLVVIRFHESSKYWSLSPYLFIFYALHSSLSFSLSFFYWLILTITSSSRCCVMTSELVSLQMLTKTLQRDSTWHWRSIRL